MIFIIRHPVFVILPHVWGKMTFVVGQVDCVTNVDSYSLCACTYVAGMTDISKIVRYHQVLFAAVTKLQRFEEKQLIFFLLQGFTKMQISTYALLRICAIRCLKTTRIYLVFPV